jgi:hypothetical protein
MNSNQNSIGETPARKRKSLHSQPGIGSKAGHGLRLLRKKGNGRSQTVRAVRGPVPDMSRDPATRSVPRGFSQVGCGPDTVMERLVREGADQSDVPITDFVTERRRYSQAQKGKLVERSLYRETHRVRRRPFKEV